jgi:predicted nucleotidyltransferase
MPTRPELLKQCVWPQLPAPYNQALHEAVQFILSHVEDIRGILVSGTILRGNPSPSSDLDIYVIREKPQRQRMQHWFNGVPAEIFINPLSKVYDYFEEERKGARPITAHMLHTGFVILALDSCIGELQQQAVMELNRSPDPSPQQLTMVRYTAATRYEDAIDIVEKRPETANMILSQAVYAMVHYAFLKANRFLPRDKDLLFALENLDAELGEKTKAFYGSTALEERFALARDIADMTIEARGFFSWESEQENL